MKDSPTVEAALRSRHEVKVLPRLLADWNMNRYIGVTADNIPSEDTDANDNEYFPIESIVEPIRPTKGIVKARIGESAVSDDYESEWRPRFYVASVDDKYKYWTSPGKSDANGNISRVAPHILYDEDVEVNKIVIKLENTWATPSDYNVQVTTDGGSTWTAAATTPVIRNDGQIILYWNGAGWSSTRPDDLSAMRTINGVRLNVTSLSGGIKNNGQPTRYRMKRHNAIGYDTYDTNGANAHFSLIEISARREVDLTDRLISVDDTFDMSDVSNLYPIGTLTSNVGTVNLWNGDELLNRDNAASPLYRFLDANVELNLDYVYDIDGVDRYVQQFKMYSGPWGGQSSDTVSVELADYSKFFQETTPLPAMWENLAVPEIIWRLCDSVGFVDYSNDVDDRVANHTIPVFWVNGEQTMWEVLNDLAIATQTAIYFDNHGILQVKTREAAFDDAKEPVWTLRGQKNGTELADIIEMQQTAQFETNHVTVTYQTTKWSSYNNGQPALQVVWEPEDENVVLRASALTATLERGDAFMRISADDVELWPFEGLVNIQGELIRYSGKRYIYYTGPNGGQRNFALVTSDAERKKYRRLTPDGYKHKNHYTGALWITERGVWNSEPKRHPVNAEGYSVRHIVDGTRRTGVFGFQHNKSESKVTLKPGKRFKDYKDVLYVTRGAPDDTGFFYYGTRFNFVKEKGLSDQIAGMYIHANSLQEDGYYFEFKPTTKIDAKMRGMRHELLVYSRKNGEHKRIGPAKGIPLAIAENVEYDLDIFISTSHEVSVFVNGRHVLSDVFPGAWQNAKNGRFGFFMKGKTKVQYEYLYAVARDENQPEDDSAFLDRVRGEFRSGQWDREWVYQWRKAGRRKRKGSTKNRSRWNRMFMDEFGPLVHEIREYNVAFDPNPILHSRLYMTNDWSTICTEYRADAFGASFVIANTDRKNAVVHGEERATYAGTSKEIQHTLTVLGRPLIIAEGESVVAKNEEQILARGQIEAELTSQWIQSKAMAKDISNWIKNHWGEGAEQQTATVFGNPLIEVGDVVAVDFQRKHMSPETHKYFVTGVSTSFDHGITTTLTLRRVV